MYKELFSSFCQAFSTSFYKSPFGQDESSSSENIILLVAIYYLYIVNSNITKEKVFKIIYTYINIVMKHIQKYQNYAYN